jgi:hypothetical protein
MAGLRLTAGLALLLAAAGPATAQENPIDFLKRLIAPPAKASSESFRPTRTPDIAATAPAPPAKVPLPPERPDHENTAALPTITAAYPPAVAAPPPAEAQAAEIAAPVTVADDAVPVPLLGYAPNPTPSPFDALIPTPRERPDSFPVVVLPPLIQPPPAARSTCGAALAMVGVTAEPMAPIAEGGGCAIAAPVAVTSFEDGDVTLTETAVIECRLAEKVADWLTGTVQPAAQKTLGSRVGGLRIAASYSCRNRNNLADTKLSEHAKGNAIDISAFRVDGRWIAVGEASGDDQRFLSAVRKSACGPFTTVLGPGADVYHSDHFHLDQAKRRTAGPSRGLYCR